MSGNDIFHRDFQIKPWWWEDYEPQAVDLQDVPTGTTVAIIGAGYAGLAAALELHKQGIDAVVLEAEQPGFGGSTRSGGLVSSGTSVGKRYTSASQSEQTLIKSLQDDASDGFELVKQIIIDEKIDCHLIEKGRFQGAWCNKHYEDMKAKVEMLQRGDDPGAYLVPFELQTEEIGSTYYRGGMVAERAGHLHPSLYFKGLLDACLRRGIKICAKAGVKRLHKVDSSWKVETSRGDIVARDVVVATNGYTGDATPQFKRRLVPMGSYMIATEELPDDLARTISPKDRAFAATRRVLTYYRMSPDGKRLLFGGRAKFGRTDPLETAPILYEFMTDRFPQLKGCKITHAWTGFVAFTLDEVPHMGQMDGLHYALGCNGSGVIMMTYLGTQIARKIASGSDYKCSFDSGIFPDSAFYNGNPWFVPTVGRYFRMRDWIDRKFN
jgi:glycine/D-amino acid oxidase-like deaminating enzyme